MTQKELSNKHGIPLAHLKAAKELSCAGQKDNRWKWDDFEPWYLANKNKVLEFINEKKSAKGGTVNEWKERRLKAQALIEEIKLAELQGRLVDIIKVLSIVKNISTSQSIILRNQSQELPHKLLGKDLTSMQVILSKEYDKICKLFQSPIGDWTQQGIHESSSNPVSNNK